MEAQRGMLQGANIQGDVHLHYDTVQSEHARLDQLLQNQQQILQILQAQQHPQQPQQNQLQADQLQQILQTQNEIQQNFQQSSQRFQRTREQTNKLRHILQTQEELQQQLQHLPQHLQLSHQQLQEIQQQAHKLQQILLAEELRKKLFMNAEEVIAQFVLPIDIERTIKRVNLQICKVKQHSDADWETESSSLEWRMCMERKQAQTVYGTDDQRISINEIFDIAKKIATDEAERKFNDENSRKDYIKKHGNTVALTGLPGIGKTTLTQMVTQSILDKLILPGTQYLFNILIRNINFEKTVSVSQFLIENSLPGQAYSDRQYKAITQELQNNPNVVIVLDGLDEAAVPFSTITHCCQLDTKEKPVDIIKNLFNATLLPNANKIVTSRPGPFYQIHQDYRPTIVLEVLGLDKAAQEELIKQICGEEKYPGIEELLEQKANLSSMCYVPVNCIYITDSLLSGVGDINSMTQVLISTFTKYIASGLLKNMDEVELRLELIKLTELAFKGFEKKNIVFDKNDLEEVQLSDSVVANFLHTYVEQSSRIKIKILDGKKRSYFAHLTLQEFFSAIYVMLFMPFKSIAGSRLNDVHWNVVLRFMFGLCHYSAYNKMKDIFPALMIRDFEEKKKMLLNLIVNQNLSDNDTLIKVSGWVYESNDEKISSTFDKHLPSDVKLKLPNDPSKVHDVAFALRSCSAFHNLSVAFTTEALIFFRGLLQHSTNFKIKNLTLKDVNMTNLTEYLVRRMNDIDRLELKNCKHLSAAMKELGPAINQRSKKIELEICSKLDEDGAKALGDCLRNISKLRIDESRISVRSRIILREVVQQLSNPQDLVVDYLGWDQHAGDQWVKTWTVYISDDADNMKRILQLKTRKITRLGLQACFKSGTWHVDLNMREIAGYLQPHMKVLDELRLYGCERLIVGLSQAINERQNKMKLGMICNKFNKNKQLPDEVVQCLSSCLGKISELNLRNYKLSPSSHLIMQDAIKQLPSPQDFILEGKFISDLVDWFNIFKRGRDNSWTIKQRCQFI